MKTGELARRKKIKQQAKEQEAEAREAGTAKDELKFHMRQVIFFIGDQGKISFFGCSRKFLFF